MTCKSNFERGKEHYDRKEYTEAAGWFLRGVSSRSVSCMGWLGHCYEFGLGVEKNLSQAKDLYYSSFQNLGSTQKSEKFGIWLQERLEVLKYEFMPNSETRFINGIGNTAGFAEAVWTAIGLAIGTYINWLIVSKRLRRYSVRAGNAITLPEFFSNRFRENKKTIMLIAAAFILIFFTVYASSCFVTCGKLFSTLFDAPYVAMLIIGAVFVLVYTFLGGFLGVDGLGVEVDAHLKARCLGGGQIFPGPVVGLDDADAVSPVADADEGEVEALGPDSLPVDLALMGADIDAAPGGAGGAGHIAVYGGEIGGGVGVVRQIGAVADGAGARQDGIYNVYGRQDDGGGQQAEGGDGSALLAGLPGAAAFFLFGHRGLLGKSFVQYIIKGRIRQVPAGKFRIALVLGDGIVYNESVNINFGNAMRSFSTSPEGIL